MGVGRAFDPRVPRRTARKTSTRDVLDTIFYVLRIGCPWRELPKKFSPKSTTVSEVRFDGQNSKGTPECGPAVLSSTSPAERFCLIVDRLLLRPRLCASTPLLAYSEPSPTQGHGFGRGKVCLDRHTASRLLGEGRISNSFRRIFRAGLSTSVRSNAYAQSLEEHRTRQGAASTALLTRRFPVLRS